MTMREERQGLSEAACDHFFIQPFFYQRPVDNNFTVRGRVVNVIVRSHVISGKRLYLVFLLPYLERCLL